MSTEKRTHISTEEEGVVADLIGDMLVSYCSDDKDGVRKALRELNGIFPEPPTPTKEPPSKIWECPMCKYRQVDVGTPDVIGR